VKKKSAISNNPIKKWGSELNKEVSPEEYRMAEKHLNEGVERGCHHHHHHHRKQ
jgi:hypothetical protein